MGTRVYSTEPPFQQKENTNQTTIVQDSDRAILGNSLYSPEGTDTVHHWPRRLRMHNMSRPELSARVYA